MKRFKIQPQRTISGRLMTRVLIVSAFIFTLTFAVFLHMAANKMREEATDRAHSELSNTIHQIDAILHSVEVAVENTAWVVPHRLGSPEFMYNITRRLIENNEFIYGCAVAFEPNYFSSEGHFFSPYAYRGEDGEIKSKQLGTDTYDYHYMDWYQIPKLLNKPYWSEPYYDDGGGEKMMTTFSMPLYDSEGNFYAIITAENTSSIAFHQHLGYTFLARFDRCGYKFGRWLGIVWMQKPLNFVDIPTSAPIPWIDIGENHEIFPDILDILSLS